MTRKLSGAGLSTTSHPGAAKTNRSSALDEREVRRFAREEVREVLRRLLSTLDGPDGYLSRRGHGPPGYSAERWPELAKRIGVKRGRWYWVSREALAAHEAGEASPVTPTTGNDAKPWHPSMAAADLGLRVIGGGK